MQQHTQGELGRAIIALADKTLALESKEFEALTHTVRRQQAVDSALYIVAAQLWPALFGEADFIMADRKILTEDAIYVFHISSPSQDDYIDIEVTKEPRDEMFALLSDETKATIAAGVLSEATGLTVVLLGPPA